MRWVAIAFVLVFAGLCLSARAQDYAHTVVMNGVAFQCIVDDEPVLIEFDTEDEGGASAWVNRYGERIISLNPDQLSTEYAGVIRWSFLHECAHHTLRRGHSEADADCWAARRMRRLGLLQSRRDMGQFDEDMGHWLATDEGHLSGEDRIRIIENCAFGN